MFTGIIEETGTIKRIDMAGTSGSLIIECQKVLEKTQIGDSIAVNGICLTVTTMTENSFRADVMAETIRQTSLRKLGPGSRVNLERAMAADGRFGGHIVAGHIDGVGTVTAKSKEENATWLTVSCDPHILRYTIDRGSITLDGISLTVAYVDDEVFKVSIIPHTGAMTTLIQKEVGDPINIENDMVGKYVEKLMTLAPLDNKKKESNISMEMLSELGF